MGESGVERRLTTILAIDVVGYSRLMGADEAGTLSALKALRRDLVNPKEIQYRGRTVKLMGDGALMEFASVIDAATFAVEVQAAMAERNNEIPEDRRIVHRIGINIGDIIVEGGAISDEPEQEYFADDSTDDLIIDLSRVSGLFVIARNSTFVYKSRSVQIRQVAEELGVRYVMEGSVRRADDRIRINAQLIDAKTGSHLWSDRYDRDYEDVFKLQDEVIGDIVAAFQVELTDTEKVARKRREQTANLGWSA